MAFGVATATGVGVATATGVGVGDGVATATGVGVGVGDGVLLTGTRVLCASSCVTLASPPSRFAMSAFIFARMFICSFLSFFWSWSGSAPCVARSVSSRFWRIFAMNPVEALRSSQTAR